MRFIQIILLDSRELKVLRLVKTFLNRHSISFNAVRKLNHYLEVYIQYGYSIKKMEFQIEKQDPQFVIETLKKNIKSFDRCVKFSFYDRLETVVGEKIILGSPINESGKYYFGKGLSMIEVSSLNVRRGYCDNTVGYDEYQFGGVLHRRSGSVFPLYTNDVVINVDVESENESFEEEHVKLKQIIR